MKARIADLKVKVQKRIVTVYLSGCASDCTRSVGGDSLPLIEYSWSCVSMIRKRMTKSKIYPFSYRGVLAISYQNVGSYSLSLIKYL